MQGLAYKATLVAIFSLAFLSSPVFARDLGNSSAGCMGCHQGETIASDAAPVQSSHHQAHKNRNKHPSQQISKADILPE